MTQLESSKTNGIIKDCDKSREVIGHNVESHMNTILKEQDLISNKDRTSESMYLNHLFLQDKLLPCLTVSTMSITFRLSRTIIDLDELANSLSLNDSGILTTDYQGVIRTIRTTKKKKKRKKHNFYNSMTLEVSVGYNTDRAMHFKVFKNGSIQGAGCQSTGHGNHAIHALLQGLSSTLKCDFQISDLKINLINVNFKIGHGVNRDSLHLVLLSAGHITSYEKCKHAGVSVKFLPKDKARPISIFVFESGSVVITGSKNENHILEGHAFIRSFIENNKSQVYKISTTKLFEKTLAHPQYSNLLLSPLPRK
jgi:TATA-box binding protein (TBP) (component of TFIID and TFIIIB)